MKYDKIIQENLNSLIGPIREQLLGIRYKNLERISRKMQATGEREADFLAKVKSEQGEKYI